MRTVSLSLLLLATSPAFADEPTPPSESPDPAPADPAPVDPPPADPPVAAESPPPPPADPVPAAPAAAPASVLSQPGVFEDAPPTRAASPGKPRLAVELAATFGRLADPYVVYKGYRLENGTSIGARLEASYRGIALSYELARMSNTQACSSDSCFAGDFGSTTIHVVELGYRLRLQVGPVRPFLQAGIGGVLANLGGWSDATSKTIKGGEARGAIGVEIPIRDQFFATAAVAYRFLVTENPLRDADADTANMALISDRELPNGDYAEDAHLITGYVGIGVAL